MIYNTDKIARAVRVVLDRNHVSTPLDGFSDADTLGVDEIIKSRMELAVRNVHTAAPVYLLEHGHNIGDEIYWNGDGSGWLLLPEDFMRLVSFRMSDWERTVYEAITPDAPSYPLQRSRFRGLRGTPSRPVCALCVRPEGKVLEFYSCGSEDAFVDGGVYIPYPSTDGGGIDISERCYDAAVYECASLVATSLGDPATAAYLRAEARSAMQLPHTEEEQ